MNGNEIQSLFIHGVSSFENIVEIACGIVDNPKKTGGFVCIADNNGNPIALMPIGTIRNDEVPKYSGFCMEKARRLGSHPDHISSWQSRNEAEEKFGGAIRYGQCILSFSGLTDHWDEACMVAFALHRLGLPAEMVEHIKGISRNPVIPQLLLRIEVARSH